MTYYVGILDGRKKVWGVRFPDFPGCHGGGPTPDAAIADATGALREFAAMMVTDGEPLPRARTPDGIPPDEQPGQGESLVMIPLLLDRARPVKANISLDAGLLEAIDAEATRRGLTRSAFLVSAAVDKIENAGAGGERRQRSLGVEALETHDARAGGFAESDAKRLKPGNRPKRR
jgi:predicted RNase H-like HicB family nuclease